MSDGTTSQGFPPIAAEDLAKLGVDGRLIPFVVSAISQAERSSNGSSQLSPTEAKDLVEVLDKILSSPTIDLSLRNRCSKVLRKVSSSHGVMPESYSPTGVTLSDTIHHISGGFADIWKGELDGHQVCVKAIRTQPVANLKKINRRFYREVIAWKYVLHPNVLPLLGVSELFQLSVITPWLPNGNIVEYIKNNREVDRLLLLAQVASGLEYLHSLGIVHSNVTPGNIMITEGGDARLGNFRAMRIITDPASEELNSWAGSEPAVVRYVAPELLDLSKTTWVYKNPPKESDIYSLAMTAYEVLTGVLPFGFRRESLIAFMIVSGERPPLPDNPTAKRWLPGPTWTAIQRCLNENLQYRLPIDSLRQAFVEPEPERESEITHVVSAIEDDTATARINTESRPPSPEPPSPDPCEQPPPEEGGPAKGTQPPTRPDTGRSSSPVQALPVKPKKLKKKVLDTIQRVVHFICRRRRR